MTCPHCGNDDPTLMERLAVPNVVVYRCDVCSKNFEAPRKV